MKFFFFPFHWWLLLKERISSQYPQILKGFEYCCKKKLSPFNNWQQNLPRFIHSPIMVVVNFFLFFFCTKTYLVVLIGINSLTIPVSTNKLCFGAKIRTFLNIPTFITLTGALIQVRGISRCLSLRTCCGI